ncbi:MAG: hypothetical protein ACI4JY_03735 [Oscillospiraceae bacterium]
MRSAINFADLSLSKNSGNRLARKLQMLGSAATARLGACRGGADNADGALSTA